MSSKKHRVLTSGFCPADAPAVAQAEVGEADSPEMPLLAGGRLPPECLSRDFSSQQERTQRAVRALYSVLIEEGGSPALRSTYERWSRLFSVATEYGRQKANSPKDAAWRKILQAFGLGTVKPNFGRFVFATHTLFAILAKLLALSAVNRYSGAPAAPLRGWPLLADADFAERFVELEGGAPFRDAGLRNFLGGDFFGWYAGHLTPELLDSLRAVVARLVEYDCAHLDAVGGAPRDLLKKVYLRLVSPAVRKALGEYYTPDWLAQRLLDLLEAGEFRGDPDTRLLDPACGSGTFLLLAINAVQRNPRSRSMDPSELVRKLCQNIVGIDLNPLAVIAARTNYLLALGPLLRCRGREAVEIPVYLGDSIRIPTSEPRSRRREEADNFAETLIAPPHVGASGNFDYVAGNPPWIGWENLPEDYRRATKDLWHQHGLFVHRGMDTILGKGKKDLSMLMTCVAADHYLKPGGKLGFVITQAVFKMAGAGQGFRRFLTRGNVPLRCEGVEDYSALQLFDGAKTKTTLFVIKKGEKQKYPTPYLVFRPRLSAQKFRFDYDTTIKEAAQQLQCEEWQAEPSDPRDPASPWLTGSPFVIQAVKKILGQSDYRAHQGVNTGGANAVFWFKIEAEDGDDGVIARNLIGAAKRKVKCQSVRLEKSRLFPLLRGQDVSSWRALPSAWLLFVQDLQTRRGVAESEMVKTPDALRWLRKHKRMLLRRAAYKRFFKPQTAPFWSMFDVGHYTFKPWKVVWPRIAWRLEAAVVSSFRGKIVLAQETFSCIGLDGEAEAFYVAGVVNATPFRFAVSAFSQPGSKSFGTPSILERARIPRFNPVSPLHQKISAEARRLSGGAPDRAKEAQAGLDALCRNLWGLTEKELQGVQQADQNICAAKAGK